MKFRKGSKVELFSQHEGATGAWCCAEIISGKGHTYSVKCLTSGNVMERVPRKALRPCPPPIGAVDLATGDLVEVFHNSWWRTATIVKAMGKNYFLVRLIDPSAESTVHKSYIRLRRCWEDERWFVIRKNADMHIGNRQLDSRINLHDGEACSDFYQNKELSAKSLKRRLPIFSCNFEAASRKKRTINRGDDDSMRLYPSSEKVDVDVYPNEMLDENYIHCPELFGREANRVNVRSPVEPITYAETYSCASSVGSCSVMASDNHYSSFRVPESYDNVNADYSSDAESSCAPKYEEGCILSSNDGLGVDGNRSDLHSYYSTVRKLYNSGPLSWEDEEQLTNLRHVLNVSDDEHLILLRNLISAC